VITYLKVRNLAIVEELAIEPGSGLNVLTGETGAGKSLLIDSLEFLRGARGSTEMIRSGTDKMTAEAVFHVPKNVAKQLEEIGIDFDTAGELIVRREIGGRSRVLINGSPLSVRELGAAMDALLEIHGQHESHQRVAGQTHRELVDEYGDHETLLDATRSAYREWKVASDQLQEMSEAQRDRALRLDLLKYQVDEISAAKLDPPEEDALREEKAVLSHAREMIEATSGAFRLVDEDEDSSIAQLGRAIHLLQPLSKHIADVRQIADDLQDALYRLQEVARTLGRLSETVRHDPARLEQVEDRLVTIERLRKKYGGTIESVLEHLGRIQDEYDRLADYEASLDKLQQAEASRLAVYRKAAEKLSAARKKAARAFEQAIQKELNDLAMERTTVRVVVSSRALRQDSGQAPRGTPGAEGMDDIDILIAPNRGEEPKPMQRIASGGELSRIQLAIAAALFKASTHAAAATLVFDEIDAGIGGRVAEIVGRKLQELAARRSPASRTRTSTSGKRTRADTHARASAGSTIARSASARSRECWAERRSPTRRSRMRASCSPNDAPLAHRRRAHRVAVERDREGASRRPRRSASHRHDLRPARRRDGRGRGRAHHGHQGPRGDEAVHRDRGVDRSAAGAGDFRKCRVARTARLHLARPPHGHPSAFDADCREPRRVDARGENSGAGVAARPRVTDGSACLHERKSKRRTGRDFSAKRRT
jgi:DNA repair protein RecN (Recombination protein N)